MLGQPVKSRGVVGGRVPKLVEKGKPSVEVLALAFKNLLLEQGGLEAVELVAFRGEATGLILDLGPRAGGRVDRVGGNFLPSRSRGRGVWG